MNIYNRGGSRISEGGVLTIVGWLRKAKLFTSSYSVQSTLSMRSMLYLGGSGGMPPQKNFANLAYSVLKFDNILTEK